MENNTDKQIVIKKLDDDSSEQHIDEIKLFLIDKSDNHIKDCMKEIGIDVSKISDYMLFVFIWLCTKECKKYTHSIAFEGLDIWDMNIAFLDEDTIVFVNDKNNIVFNETFYNLIADTLRKK